MAQVMLLIAIFWLNGLILCNLRRIMCLSVVYSFQLLVF